MALLRAYREAFSGLSREIWILSAAALIHRSGTMVLPFLALYLTREQGFDKTRTGAFLALYGLGAIFGALLGGQASDRLGAFRVMTWSLLGQGLGFLVLGRMTDPVALGLVLWATSTVGETFRPANMAAITQAAAPARRTRALALLRLAINVGMAIGPVVGGFLAEVDYYWLFVGDAITCWAAAIFLLVIAHGRRRRRRASGVEPEAPGPPVEASPARDLPFLAFLFCVFVTASLFFQLLGALPVYWREALALTESQIGLIFGWNTGIIIALEMLLVARVERFDAARICAVGAALVGLGIGLFPLHPTVGFLAFTVVIWTVGEMLVFPFSNAVVAARAVAGAEGRYMGWYGLSFSSAFAVAPMVGLWLYDRLGAEALWYGVGGVSLVLAAAFWALARPLALATTEEAGGA